MYKLRASAHFDSAHYLFGYEGKCSRLHGHRWVVEVEITSERLDAINMMIDFSKVKRMMNEICDKVDHYEINVQLAEPNPTAEFLAKWFYDCMKAELDLEMMAKPSPYYPPPHVSKVTIWESPECCVSYEPDQIVGGV